MHSNIIVHSYFLIVNNQLPKNYEFLKEAIILTSETHTIIK